MEVYAAAVEAVDASTGRLVEHLERLGELDNTIIVFTSDNGGTAEGGAEGTRSYYSQFAHVAGLPDDWDRDVDRDLDLIGGPRTTVHYPRGWGQASNTPFRLYKAHTFAGGIRAPLIVHWPGGELLGSGDDGLRRQYVHVTDLTPTLLELAGGKARTERYGIPVKDFDGVSLTQVWHADAPSTHTQQYLEIAGHRAYYRDNWKLVSLYAKADPVDEPRWHLYNVAADPAECHDVAAEHPDQVAELAEAWERDAWRNTVFPLVEGSGEGSDAFARRRPADNHLSAPVRIPAGTPTLERYRSLKLIQYRDFTAVVELAGYVPGDEGAIALTMPSPTRAMIVSSVAPPISWFEVGPHRHAGLDLELDAVLGDGVERLARLRRGPGSRSPCG